MDLHPEVAIDPHKPNQQESLTMPFYGTGAAFDMEEAVTRMTRRKKKSVRWTLRDVTVRWDYIPASSARNWDGSSAGQEQDSNKEILQRMTWRDGGEPRFSNWW
ncbi:hypothetical protein ACKFKG_26840 [Phormidesmis sp. 146-35]